MVKVRNEIHPVGIEGGDLRTCSNFYFLRITNLIMRYLLGTGIEVWARGFNALGLA